jgi:Rhodanese-related sulfurtransferase
LLDVRTKKETDLGHLEHAILVDYFNTNFTTIAAAKLDKEKTVYVVCRTGNRSTKAAVLLQNQGFKVINVKGGFNQ